jgi:hypothetical protein
MNGIEEGDFTMVFGFPGRTEEYLTSDAIRQIKEVINPARISIREDALELMHEKMKADDKVRIQYASKYARVANYWKKWIGENKGLEASKAIEKKEEEEAAFQKAVAKDPKYSGLIEALAKEYEAIEPYSLARNYFIEIPYRKVELLYLASRFRKWFEADEVKMPSEKEIDDMISYAKNFYKDFDRNLDETLADHLLKKYRDEMSDEFKPEFIQQQDEGLSASIDELYANSIFTNEKKVLEILESKDSVKIMSIAKDPTYDYMAQFYDIYNDKIKPEYGKIKGRIDSLQGLYMEGLRKYIPANYYPDANSTLRLAYGKVEGYNKLDGKESPYFTTAEQLREKYQEGHADFDLPERLLDLIDQEDFGP